MAQCLNVGVQGCLAGEVCVSDDDCVLGDKCIAAPEIYGNTTVCSNDSAQGKLVAWIFVYLIMSASVFFCLFISLRNARRLRQAIKRRAEKKKKEAKGQSGASGSPVQQKCDELYQKAKEIRNVFGSQLEDVNNLYIAEDRKQTLFMYEFLVLTTMAASYANQGGQQGGMMNQQNYMMERRLWYLAAYLEQATSGMWYSINPENDVQVNRQVLAQTQQLLTRTAEYFQLPSPYQGVAIAQVLRARYDDAQFGQESPNFRQLSSRALSFRPAFAAPTSSGGEQEKPLLFRQVRRFKLFYGLLFAICFSIFMAFAVKINTDNATVDGDNDLFRGGFGQTFLPVPPQYNMDNSPLQAVTIPILYGLMHNALFFLGILPLPMCRGLWRDIVDKVPTIRQYAPVDNLPALHRLFAYSLFSLIFAGAVLWTVVMTIECKNNVPRACLAFAPAVNNFVDPIENVVALRFAVFLLWPWMGLIYFAPNGPPRPLNKYDRIRLNWFEICYYTHTVVAHATLVLAMISRTEVFYPVLAGWSVYWLDWMRETFFHTKRADLIDAQLFGRAKDGVPTSMRLKMLPNGSFKIGAGQYFYIKVPSIDQVWHPFTLCSASNDTTIQAHIGIIAGKKDWQRSQNGMTAGQWESKSKTWTYKLFKLVSNRGKASIPCQIRGPYGSSFTSCFDPAFSGTVMIAAGTGLSAAESVLRETLERRKAGFAGPGKLWVVYACREEDSLLWAWERVVSLLVKAVEDGILDIHSLAPRSNVWDWVGITMYVTQSTPKMLQQFTDLNRNNKAFKLRESIFARATIRRGAVNPNANNMKVQAYNPQASNGGGNDMEYGNGNQYPKPLRNAIQSIAKGTFSDLDLGFGGGSGGSSVASGARNGTREGHSQKIREWLLNKVIAGSLDDEDTHIERFLLGAAQHLKESGYGSPRLSVGFCGPPALAITISEAVRVVESKSVYIEFAAESQ